MDEHLRTSDPDIYARPPYFHSDQHDLGMENCGYLDPGGHDRFALRGDVERLADVSVPIADL